MKKILFVITKAENGGAQKYVLDLATNLDKTKYDVLVAAGGQSSEWLFRILTKHNIKAYPLKFLRREIKIWQDVRAVWELFQLINAFRPKIIHLNSSKAGAIGSIAAFLVSPFIRVIYTAHGFVFNEPLSPRKQLFYLMAEKFTSIFKNKIITVSDFDRHTGIINKIASKKKLITIHNGIQPKIKFLSSIKARARLNLPEYSSPIIGTIANYYPTKGLDRFVAAAATIVKKFGKTKFIIIGDGQLRNRLEQQIQDLHLTNNFLLGRIENASELLKAFDVFALPSVKEGFPYTLLEAIAAEVPIVATKVGGIPEIITNGENGFLIPSDNETADNLAKKITYYLEHPQIVQIFTEKAYRKLQKNFTLDIMLERTEQIYNQ